MRLRKSEVLIAIALATLTQAQSGNPLAGRKLYVDPNSTARR